MVENAQPRMLSKSLSMPEKAAYGAVYFSEAVVAFGINLYLLFFYSSVIKVGVERVGCALLVGKLWDAVTDPVMGHVSDRTPGRFGRRRPYIVCGGLLLALSLILLWAPPPGIGAANGFAYVLVFYILFSTFYTVLMIPYAALGAELTPYYEERTSLFTWASALGSAGAVVAALVWRTLVESHQDDPRRAFTLAGVVCASAVVLGALITSIGTRERYKASQVSRGTGVLGLLRASGDALRNRAFMILFVVFVIAAIGTITVISMLKFVAQYWLRDNPPFGTIMLVYAVATVMGVPLWGWIARVLDKKRAYLATLAASALCFAGSFAMLRPGASVAVWCWSAWFGICAAGLLMLPRAILPDVIDEDELVSGERREGIYSGMVTFAIKLTAAVGVYLASLGLKLAGYDTEAVQQTTRAIATMRVAFGPIPGVFLAICLLIFIMFPITRERANATREILKTRRSSS